MKLLADADFLIALIKPDDSNSLKARQKAQRFKSASIYITPFTIPETATVLSYKISHEAAKRFLREARKENFTMIELSENLTTAADHIFEVQTAKGISWIDCLNAAAVSHFRLDGILSFDKFYRRLKITML